MGSPIGLTDYSDETSELDLHDVHLKVGEAEDSRRYMTTFAAF